MIEEKKLKDDLPFVDISGFKYATVYTFDNEN